MKIGVCVKQVPAKDAPLAIVEGGAWIRESDIGFETNEPDGFALEEALRLKEKHTAKSWPSRWAPSARSKPSRKRSPRAPIAASTSPTTNSSSSIRSAPRVRWPPPFKGENFDLILTGLQSDDQGFGQTGVLLAELLGRPHATIIMEIEVTDGRMKLKRELEAGWFQWVELPLPAVLTIQSGINKPRYATLKGIMAAKKKEIATIERASLGVSDAPTQHVERIYVPQKTKKTEFITGQPKEIAAKLIEKLRHEARVCEAGVPPALLTRGMRSS